MQKFFGRQQELAKLDDLLKLSKSSLAVITGRRRIGKSRLVSEFCKGKKHYIFEGLAPGAKITNEHERLNFADQLQYQLKIPRPNTENWSNLLRVLADHTTKQQCIILLDEINWLGHNDPTFLDVFKQVWDQAFSHNPKLIIILSGSISSWIHRNILSDTKFLGRISLSLTLKELPLSTCDLFWGRKRQRLSAHEKLKILSMTGGVPRYLEEIIPSESAEQNMLRLAFQPEGLLFREFDQLFSDLYSQRNNTYQSIVKTLLYQSKEPSEIIQDLGKIRSGTFSQYFDELVKTSILVRDDSWSLHSTKISRLHKYRIADNYVRFYLQFIYPLKNQILRGHFTKLPNISSKLGFQFENLVLANRLILFNHLLISSNDVLIDNPYFQRPTKTKPGCQFDYLIQTRQKTLYACEIKFHTEKLGIDVVRSMEIKLANLALPRGFSIRPILIHVNGVSESVKENETFDTIIDFGELFFNK